MNYQKASHGFPPLYDSSSEVLILGSFPSVKSRKQSFFYGHPQNRFWKVLAACFNEAEPLDSIERKKAFCLRHKIALYDSIEECEIVGSSDASIKGVVPADLEPIFDAANIRLVLFNGTTAKKYFYLYNGELPGIDYQCLPSTSAANASWKIDQLIEVWKGFLQF